MRLENSKTQISIQEIPQLGLINLATILLEESLIEHSIFNKYFHRSRIISILGNLFGGSGKDSRPKSLETCPSTTRGPSFLGPVRF